MSDIALHYPTRWTVSRSPHSDELEHHTLEWAHRTLPLPSDTRDLDRLRVMRAGSFGGYSYPGASRRRLEAICDLLALWLLLDDHLEGVLPELDEAQRRSYCSLHMEALATGLSPRDPSGFVHGLADVGVRIKSVAATPTWYRFLTSMAEYFEGVLAEVAHLEAGLPGPRSRYLGYRHHAAGAYPVLDLIEVAHGYLLPLAFRSSEELAELRSQCATIICCANDIVSYSKDVEAGRANLITILERLEGLPRAKALAETARLHDRAVARFDAIASQVLARQPHEPTIRAHLDHARALTRGLTQWQMEANRYQALDSGRWLSITHPSD